MRPAGLDQAKRHWDRPFGRQRYGAGRDRPGVADPLLIPAGGPEEDEAPRRGSNAPPDDFSLQEVFPSPKDVPGLAIPLAPIDGFLGIGVSADAANLDGTMLQYRYVIAQIKAIDPTLGGDELLRAGGIAGLSWPGRNNLLNHLRMERAAAYYRRVAIQARCRSRRCVSCRKPLTAPTRKGRRNTTRDDCNSACRVQRP